jgi:hypothetical protein
MIRNIINKSPKEQIMGEMGWNRFGSQRRMEARDFIWLAALGCGQRLPFDLEDLCLAIDDIAGQVWTPSVDVVAGCIEEMVRGGTLAPVGPAQDRFCTTEAGRQILALLLGQPCGQVGCPLGQVGLRMKLAFLDLAPNELRREHLDQIIAACRDALEECQRRCDICAAEGRFGQQWLRHEADRLRRDLGALLDMREDEPPVSRSVGMA